MQYRLSFAIINLLSDQIAEIIVDNHVVISLEMLEELDGFTNEHFVKSFGLIVNKINSYRYTFEAKSYIATNQHQVACAVVNYGLVSEDPIYEVKELRPFDHLNIKVFSGLEFGWQQAKKWLNDQLVKQSSK